MKVRKIMEEILRKMPKVVEVEIDRTDDEDTTSYILYGETAHCVTQGEADDLLEFLFSEYSVQLPGHRMGWETHTFQN